MLKKFIIPALLFWVGATTAQDYFFEKYKPFDTAIPSPEEFLGYGIGEHHTRHDLIVAYLTKLAEVSNRASIEEYGRTHEGRKLVMFRISAPKNLQNLETLKSQHLAFIDPSKNPTNYDETPIFVNLGYNVHGNEPSSSEAALLTAYTFTASTNPEIERYLNDAVLFIDPTINPDGRDRHTYWANMYQGNPMVSDPQDAEHNEYWPGGRTNHYWFDLNRDWLLAIHPESRGKLNWYHKWYPNVVTDFHEMGTQSTYFFEPMKDNGSLNPIMPKENYEDLNNLFGEYFAKALDSIGSFYFSTFTIRNQYVSSLTTVKAAVENKALLRKYQQKFFKSALGNASKSRVRGYTFKDEYDQNRVKAFIDKLLLHKIDVYKSGKSYVVPTNQPQYRMVQSMFETYSNYRDSVYYDASAWSVANFYNMKYKPVNSLNLGEIVESTDNLFSVTPVQKSDYAYIIDYDDYNATAVLN